MWYDAKRLQKMRDKVAVVGVGDTDYRKDYQAYREARERGEHFSIDSEMLAVEAFKRALADSGLKKEEISGLGVAGDLPELEEDFAQALLGDIGLPIIITGKRLVGHLTVTKGDSGLNLFLINTQGHGLANPDIIERGYRTIDPDLIEKRDKLVAFLRAPNKAENYWGNIELDELRIWHKARTAEEIQQDMYRTLSVPMPELVGYWRFDGAVHQRHSVRRAGRRRGGDGP
jgi:hypothetical protein